MGFPEEQTGVFWNQNLPSYTFKTKNYPVRALSLLHGGKRGKRQDVCVVHGIPQASHSVSHPIKVCLTNWKCWG